jgi:hypothetical protein
MMQLLNGYVMGESRKNELYLGRHVDFFLTQIEDNVVCCFVCLFVNVIEYDWIDGCTDDGGIVEEQSIDGGTD